MCNLVNHTKGDREDRPAGIAAHGVGYHRFTLLDIYAHSKEGVNQGEAVGAGVFAGPGYGYYVSYVGAKLNKNGFCGAYFLNRFGNLCGGLRACAEGHAAVMHVGAGNVYLYYVNSFAIVGLGAAVAVFVHAEAADVGNYAAIVDLAQSRDFLAYQGVDSRVLKTHGIDHSAGAFGNARGGVAVAGLLGCAFKGDAAKDVKVKTVRQLQPEAKGAACGDYRVLKVYPTEVYREVYHIISSFLKTGPSLQTRLVPAVVLMLQQ